jgi:hypothetical protein
MEDTEMPEAPAVHASAADKTLLLFQRARNPLYQSGGQRCEAVEDDDVTVVASSSVSDRLAVCAWRLGWLVGATVSSARYKASVRRQVTGRALGLSGR